MKKKNDKKNGLAEILNSEQIFDLIATDFENKIKVIKKSLPKIKKACITGNENRLSISYDMRADYSYSREYSSDFVGKTGGSGSVEIYDESSLEILTESIKDELAEKMKAEKSMGFDKFSIYYIDIAMKVSINIKLFSNPIAFENFSFLDLLELEIPITGQFKKRILKYLCSK